MSDAAPLPAPFLTSTPLKPPPPCSYSGTNSLFANNDGDLFNKFQSSPSGMADPWPEYGLFGDSWSIRQSNTEDLWPANCLPPEPKPRAVKQDFDVATRGGSHSQAFSSGSRIDDIQTRAASASGRNHQMPSMHQTRRTVGVPPCTRTTESFANYFSNPPPAFQDLPKPPINFDPQPSAPSLLEDNLGRRRSDVVNNLGGFDNYLKMAGDAFTPKSSSITQGSIDKTSMRCGEPADAVNSIPDLAGFMKQLNISPTSYSSPASNNTDPALTASITQNYLAALELQQMIYQTALAQIQHTLALNTGSIAPAVSYGAPPRTNTGGVKSRDQNQRSKPVDQLLKNIHLAVEQLKAIENERKKTEVTLSHLFPDHDMSSDVRGNNGGGGGGGCPVPRVGNNPSKVDRLVAEMQKEYPKVAVLVKKAEPLFLLCNMSFPPDFQLALDQWNNAIRTVTVRRREQIKKQLETHAHGAKSHDRDNVEAALAASVKQLAEMTENARTFQWAFLQYAREAAIYYNPGNHNPISCHPIAKCHSIENPAFL